MISIKQLYTTFHSYFFLTMIVISSSLVNAGGLDPLELEEIEKVKQIQLSYLQENAPQAASGLTIDNVPQVASASTIDNALQAASDSTIDNASQAVPDSAIDLEVLLVERHPVEKGAENNAVRLADIYTYEYGRNILHQAIVNLETNAVVSLVQNTKIQLPLTENEINKAIKILSEDGEQFKLILQEYKRITGEEYSDPSQIEIKAFAFWGDSLPGVSNTESLKCGVNRCAQLLIFTPEHVAFEVSPVVNLSEKKVTQNINF